MRYDYSGSFQAAKYIKDNYPSDQKFCGANQYVISLLPYFESNIFLNHNHGSPQRSWVWSKENGGLTIESLKDCQSDLLIYGLKFPLFERYRVSLSKYGFKTIIKSFPGQIYWKNRILEEESFLIFKRGV